MLEIWTVYHFASYDLQINLAHELLVYHVCGKLDSSYKFSIDICRSDHCPLIGAVTALRKLAVKS